MIQSTAVTRITRQCVATTLAALLLSACKSDEVAGVLSFAECSDQPGCQTEVAPVAANVIPALNDATSRAATVLSAFARTSISSHIAKLEAALVDRDIARGRIALGAVLEAITAAERADPVSRADLGVIRLGLAPAARSLGLPFSVTEAPAN